MATARSVFRNVRSAASRISGGAKPNAASSARSAFRIPSQKPLSHRIFRSPVEMSCVSVESMLPFHSATASALLTSMLSAPRTCGWTLEASHDHDIGDTQSSIEYSFLKKAGLSFMGTRGFCTSMLSSESSEGSFPSDLLSRKQIITSERAIGQLQDLVIPVTNFQNEDKGMMVLAGDVFNLPIRKDIVHRVVRWQLAKRQQGTHSTKTISEVSGTGRKPYRQKGTGRARHGTLRGPQFRGGAVMHGPKPRSHAHKLNKKFRRLGLKIALSARAAEGKLLVFDDLELSTHKTKNIVSYVNEMEDTKKVLVVDGGPIDEKLKLATQNLHYVNVLPSIGLNVYSILLHDTLVMSRDAVNKIVERMNTPIKR